MGGYAGVGWLGQLAAVRVQDCSLQRARQPRLRRWRGVIETWARWYRPYIQRRLSSRMMGSVRGGACGPWARGVPSGECGWPQMEMAAAAVLGLCAVALSRGTSRTPWRRILGSPAGGLHKGLGISGLGGLLPTFHALHVAAHHTVLGSRGWRSMQGCNKALTLENVSWA